jgi:SAM-dependent methyltransferase
MHLICRKRTLGYLLHPKIPLHLGPNTRIAEIATGTGVFLRDLSQTLAPTCELDGFDISDSQFPPPEQLPNNVKLQLLDAKGPVPAHLQNRYDIINIRLLTAGLFEADWEIVAKNVMSMLKPGGWVQWQEADVAQSRLLLRADPGVPISGM